MKDCGLPEASFHIVGKVSDHEREGKGEVFYEEKRILNKEVTNTLYGDRESTDATGWEVSQEYMKIF